MNEIESARLRRLSLPYLSRLEDLQKEVEKRGQKVIVLSGNNPDLLAPQRMTKRFVEVGLKAGHGARDEKKQKLGELREAIAEWYEARFGVNLDPQNEVVVVYGAEQSFVNIAQAFINPNDGILLPSPTRPIFMVASVLAGGNPFPMLLKEKSGFLPEYESIDRRSLDRARLMFLNFPSNPTTVAAPMEFLEKTVDFLSRTDAVVCYDNSYSEIYYDNKRPGSLLQIPKARDNMIMEFYSLSTTFSISDVPVGFFVGHKKTIETMSKIFRCVENEIPVAAIDSMIVGLKQCWTDVEGYRKAYQKRRDLFCDLLDQAGLEYVKPEGTYFVWVKIPRGYNSDTFTEFLLREAAVRVRPGITFGSAGQGFVRMSLTVPDDILRDVGARLKVCLQKR